MPAFVTASPKRNHDLNPKEFMKQSAEVPADWNILEKFKSSHLWTAAVEIQAMKQDYRLLMDLEGTSNPQFGDKPYPKWNAFSIHHLTSQLQPVVHKEVFLLFCLLLAQVQCVESVTVNCSQPDAKSLLDGINKVLISNEIRPVINLTTPTIVETSFVLYGILGVDEKAQMLTTFIWHQLEWDIEYLSWDPEQCGAGRISLPRKKLWVPDILINEFMDENQSPDAPFIYLLADGRVIDSRPVRVVSSCNLDIYTFPFDVQNCTLSFNSYILKAGDVQLILGLPAEETLRRSKALLETVGEWELINITAEDIFDSVSFDFFDEVVYHVILKRRATLYVVNLLVPSIFLITVDLFSFLLPPQSVDRSSFKMTLILGYTVFLLIMNDLLPTTGNRIPLINVFFSICLALMVSSLLETVLITNMQCNSSQYPPVPQWVRVIVLQYLSRLVCLYQKPSDSAPIILNPSFQGENMEIKSGPDTTTEPHVDEPILGQLKRLGQDVQAIRQQVENHLTVNKTAEDWIQIGNIIDRLLFCLYILFISVSFIVIAVIWAQWYNM